MNHYDAAHRIVKAGLGMELQVILDEFRLRPQATQAVVTLEQHKYLRRTPDPCGAALMEHPTTFGPDHALTCPYYRKESQA